MSKYTSGDWRVSVMTMDAACWKKLNHPKAPLNIVLRGSDVIAAVWGGDDEDGEELANADLIAAAPEMLDMLKIIQALFADPLTDYDEDELDTHLENIIAKAEGRS